MSASSLMMLGIKAMAANYAALQTTGHNIANANVDGYSRQRAELATAEPQYTGAGFFGKGVNVATVTRAHDQFLTREASSARSLASMDATRLALLQRMETIFQPGANGLGNASTQLMNAMSDLSSNPADPATRRVVLARAVDLAARFSEAGGALDQAQANATADLRVMVSEVNALARNIAQTNQKIAEVVGRGQPANDLLDERDRLISQLSDKVQVTRMDASDGTTSVFMAGGQRLVLGSTAAELSVVQDPIDAHRSAVALKEGSLTRILSETEMGGGGIAGMLRFQNQDLVAGRNLVGQLAAAIGGALNTQQMRGVNLQPPLGTVPSSALFSMGAPEGIANAANARDGLGNLLAGVNLTVTDSAALQASDYDLREDPALPGAWQLTRLSDGKVTSVIDGDVVDGMQINFVGAPQPGDRFLLQPVARAANAMSVLLSNPLDLAAASPLVASTSPSNIGTASVASLTITAGPLPVPGATVQVDFVSDTGDYNWQMLDASNNLLAVGSGTWVAGQSIPPTGTDINGFALMINGVPRTGDVITIAPTPASALASNNGNALAMTALRDAAIAGGHTATDQWALALSEVGVRVQSTETSSEISTAVAQQAELMRSADAGVNLDEEAARLIQFQQSYQAAAKVLQVAQSIFDTLLSTAAR